MTASALMGAPRRRLLGTNPSLIVFTGLFVFAAYVFAWGWLSAPPNEVSNVLNVGSMLAVCVAFVFIVGTNRVVGAPAGYVALVNLFVVHRVPVEEIARVVVNKGLRLVLKSGREIGSSTYGQSLAGQLAGYPRAQQAVQRIEAFLWSLPPTSWRAPGQRPVETRVRGRDIAVGLALGLGLLLGAVVLNAVRTG